MRLTTFTDFTLRTLIYLAVRPDRLVTVRDIAQAYDISSNHLMKVVQRLAQSDYVTTVRGQRGGIRLALPAEQINIGEVVRRMESDLDVVPCFAADKCCAIQPECVLATAVGHAMQAFLDVLDQYTLADLTAPRPGLARLLGIEEAAA
jgi:Rrf2 family transcriptional regulator, nitric oxide-sensitive transcriptional repressor